MARRRGKLAWEVSMGKQLAACRKRAGLTQEQLARRARIPINSLREWEQGRRSMRLRTAMKLARALGITMNDFCGNVKA